MVFLSVLLADATMPVGIAIGLTLAGSIIGLVLKGNFHTDEEFKGTIARMEASHKEVVAQKEKSHAEQIALIRLAHEESDKMKDKAHELQVLALTQGMDKINGERDDAIELANAWYKAAEWNNEGRIEAQRAAAVVLELQDVSRSLLGLVREFLPERIKQSNV